MSKKCRLFSAEFKAPVGLEALKGIEPIGVIAQRHEVHPVQVSQWKKEVAERLPEVFAKPSLQVKEGRSGRRSWMRASGSCRWSWIGSKKSWPDWELGSAAA